MYATRKFGQNVLGKDKVSRQALRLGLILFHDLCMQAYYSSVSCGFSISEAVAFAPPDWLMIGSKRYKVSCSTNSVMLHVIFYNKKQSVQTV